MINSVLRKELNELTECLDAREMPYSSGLVHQANTLIGNLLHDLGEKDKEIASLKQQLKTARDDALEEAAKYVDCNIPDYGSVFAKSIRSLKSKEPV